MPELNPFAKRLVAMVREMPDELLLELVRNHLLPDGELGVASPQQGASKPRAKQKRGRGKAKRAVLEAEVLAIVNAGKGVALADVAAAVGAPKPRVSAILRGLKEAGAIHAAGDRRFTRYGKTKAIAAAASKKARKA